MGHDYKELGKEAWVNPLLSREIPAVLLQNIPTKFFTY